MNKIFRYMLVGLMAIFWGVRIMITISAQYGNEYLGMSPYNMQAEVAILFLTLLSMVLIIRKNVFGPVILLVANTSYYGTYLIETASELSQNQNTQINIMFSMIAIALPLAASLEWLYNKNKEKYFKDTKRDWFFANDNLNKDVDERQDQNHYRL